MVSDAWAVVLGAAIGFLGTLSGSLLAPTLQSRSERARRKEERAEVERARWQAIVRDLTAQLSDAASDCGYLSRPGHLDERLSASVKLGGLQDRLIIELRGGDEPIIELLQLWVPRMIYPKVDSNWIGPMGGLTGSAVRALSAWRRGDISAEEAATEVRSSAEAFDQVTGYDRAG